jgi:hypothetical protein
LIKFETLEKEWPQIPFPKAESGSAFMVFEEFYACIWIGVNSIALMLSKEEVKSLDFLIN